MAIYKYKDLYFDKSWNLNEDIIKEYDLERWELFQIDLLNNNNDTTLYNLWFRKRVRKFLWFRIPS